jgi:hypothetical protein
VSKNSRAVHKFQVLTIIIIIIINVGDIPGNHDVKELQLTAIGGTAHILSESANVKEQKSQRRN